MQKSKFSTRLIFALLIAVCFVLTGLGLLAAPSTSIQASAEELPVEIEKIELPDGEENTIIFHLTGSDFITAEFDENDNTAAKYKWVETLAYEDRLEHNVHNALLDKNLSELNYGEYITIDGVELGTIPHEMRANKFQRIAGLGLTFLDTASNLLSTANEIYIKGGCQLPSLARGYFGVEEPSAIVIEEDTLYRKKDGQWVKSYFFDGYEENTIYDASERFFYKRDSEEYMGYTEAPSHFTDGYQPVGDMNFVYSSSIDTEKGNVFVVDFVNPIDTSVFGTIHLNFYVHEPRNMVTYNAYGATEGNLGAVVENVVTAAGWTYVPLMLPLYADENGMVDRIVFQFTNDGDLVNLYRNQVAIGEFYLSCEKISTLLYDGSLMISETENDYNLVFRFNKKGDFTNSVVDMSKVCVNTVSLADINKAGDYASAEWISLQGIYQINITLSKAYEGEGQIKNGDIGYACNKVSVIKGLAFPNGELLDTTYHYNLYRNYTDNLIFEDEVVIDYELNIEYEETKAIDLTWTINEKANGNLQFLLVFDKKITNRMINHVCEPEAWRETILGQSGLYDGAYAGVFIASGYKSSLFDSIVINGQTVGEFHARNNHQTCVFVHYGQSGNYTLDMSIDANAPAYDGLKALFESGSGVTIEIKSGFKFATGVKTEKDFVFNLQNGVFVLEKEDVDYPVYFDGTLVEDGDTLQTEYQALSSSVFVDGTAYTVERTENGNVVTFTVKYDDKQISFNVEQTVTKAPDPVVNKDSTTDEEGGCGSSLSIGGGIVLLSTAVALVCKRRRERNE